jgi:hypothetical protein
VSPAGDGDLTCRPALPADVRANFARLIALIPRSTITAADVVVLELGARCLADVDRLSAVIAKAGDTFESPTKYGMRLTARPEVALLASAQRRLIAVLLQLGLTPASRNRVDAVTPVHADATSPDAALEALLARRDRARDVGP